MLPAKSAVEAQRVLLILFTIELFKVRLFTFTKVEPPILPITPPATACAPLLVKVLLTVQFATPQGTCSESLRLYSAGSVLGVLPRASCSGKRFVGWCYADGSPALPTDTLTDLDCILYAVFQRSIPIYATRAGIDCPR